MGTGIEEVHQLSPSSLKEGMGVMPSSHSWSLSLSDSTASLEKKTYIWATIFQFRTVQYKAER